MQIDEAVKTFWNAAERGDDAAAQEALTFLPAGIVNRCDEDDYDMLISAVQNGNACAVRALLASGKCDLDHRENLCDMTAREFAMDYPADSPVRRAFEEIEEGTRHAD